MVECNDDELSFTCDFGGNGVDEVCANVDRGFDKSTREVLGKVGEALDIVGGETIVLSLMLEVAMEG